MECDSLSVQDLKDVDTAMKANDTMNVHLIGDFTSPDYYTDSDM